MKKKLSALLLALVICVTLVACGGGPDRQPAIDAFNSANTLFTEVAEAINANPGDYDQELVDTLIELSGVLSDHKALLEGDEELTEEKLNEMIAWYGDVEELMEEIKTEYGI